MLDTNMVSYLIKGQHTDKLRLNMQNATVDQLFISTITEAELLYGMVKANNLKLTEKVEDFLDTIQVMDWNSQAAIQYSKFRLATGQSGLTLTTMDLLIASHAKAEKMTLISRDKIFYAMQPFGLAVENWFD